jgi:hypothetical protein
VKMRAFVLTLDAFVDQRDNLSSRINLNTMHLTQKWAM